jgi:hypothetical protein
MSFSVLGKINLGLNWVALFFCVPLVSATDLSDLIKAVNGVGSEGQGHELAINAMKKLSSQPPSSIPEMLKGMNRSNRLSVNWLRSAIESSAQQGPLPVAQLKTFLQEKSNSQYARRLAFELIVESQPNQKNLMLTEMLDDPSLEIRRDAVELELQKVEGIESREEKIKGYRSALEHARQIQQIKSIAESLSELEVDTDLTSHFGLITRWHLIGPFPNKEQSKFDEAYPPEKEINLEDSYKGDSGKQVSWSLHQSQESEGIVDLNKALANHKGAISYAYTEFNSSRVQPVDVRLGCINANKVWVNGKLVIANNVYHAGMNLDQYIGKTTLKSGINKILIKVCQNEQKESWAQRWQFQFRISNATGKAIVSR